MTVKLSYNIVLDALKSVVADAGPDFVYDPPETGFYEATSNTCVYRHPETGAASCGVGRAFDKLGLLDVINYEAQPDPEDYSDIANSEAVYDIVEFMVGNGYAEFESTEDENNSVKLLSDFQQLQDMQAPYGKALEVVTGGDEAAIRNYIDLTSKVWLDSYNASMIAKNDKKIAAKNLEETGN